jgi:hypothetical protein
VFRTGFGVFVGPGQTEDQIQPVESDRISTTLSAGPFLAFPVDQDVLVANFTSNPNNRSYQPRAYANEYTIPERIYQYTASVQQELGGHMTATAAYVGSQGLVPAQRRQPHDGGRHQLEPCERRLRDS